MTRRDARAATRNGLAALALLLGMFGGLTAQGSHAAMASVAGEWEITLQNAEQSFDWNVTFEQDGETVTGFAEMDGRIFPLEGWVDGNEISFAVTVDEPGHDAPLVFTGEIDGEEVAGVMDPTDGMHPEALMDWFGQRKDGSRGVV